MPEPWGADQLRKRTEELIARGKNLIMMPEPWGADVHSGLRVFFDVEGKARYSTAGGVDVQDDVLAKIAVLRLQADQLEVWMKAWSEQEDG